MPACSRSKVRCMAGRAHSESAGCLVDHRRVCGWQRVAASDDIGWQDYDVACPAAGIAGGMTAEALLDAYIALLRQHLAECPLDAAICNSCAFVRRMLERAERLRSETVSESAGEQNIPLV